MKKRIQPLVAMRALRELVRNPDDTTKVFEIIRAMAGDANEQAYARFKASSTGERILSRDKSLLDLLRDRNHLMGLAPNSFGRAYLNFLDTESLSPDGLVDASESGESEQFTDPGLEKFSKRFRDQHDLWHVLTGYGRDLSGEVCLLAFTYAQTKNRGLGIICLIGCLKQSRRVGLGLFRSVWQAHRVGKRAAWLAEQDWEALLSLPLTQVRDHLAITPPVRYLDLPGAVTSAA